MSKKIIIPRGLVNPNETTVIEIPAELSEERELIASPLSCPTGCTKNSETRPNECPGGGMTRTINQTYAEDPRSPSFRHPQATSTPRPKDMTYSFEDSSMFNTASMDASTFDTSMYDSSIFDSGSPISPRSFGTIDTGESYTGSPLPPCGTTRIIKKTSKTFTKQSMPQPYPGAGRTFTRSPDFNRTRPVQPGPDMTVFFPQIASTPIDVEYSSIYGSSLFGVSPEQSYSSTYDSYPDQAAAQGTYNIGRTQTISPAAATAGGRTYNFGQTQNISPAAAAVGRTYNFGQTQNINPAAAAAGRTHNFGRTQNMCPGACRTYNTGRTQPVSPEPGGRTFNFGRTRTMSPAESLSIGAPVATSTPQRNQTYTRLYESSLFRSSSFEPSSFGTTDSSYPDSGGAGGRTYNFGRTQNLPSNARPVTRSITKIVKKSSKTFIKPPPQGNDVGALGAAYLNTTMPRNACPPCQRTFTKPEPSAVNQTRVVKKSSQTTTIQTACGGSKTKMTREMTTVEPANQGRNQRVSNMTSKLDEIEHTERAQLAEHLKTYQDARRNIMSNNTYTMDEQNK